MPEILVKFQDKIVERVVTEKNRLTIGRTADNDIVLDNRGVSRRHAQIEFSGNSAVLIDNDSLNGTFLNQRKVSEHQLNDKDTITIGKFDLVFNRESELPVKMSDMDGTMVLNTRKQKDLANLDREAQEVTEESGGPVLLETRGSHKINHPLDKETVTLGKSRLVDIRVKGFRLAKIQAKLMIDSESVTLVNVGRQGKSSVNGEPTENTRLKNGDIVQVGRSTFRFISES